MDNFTTFIDAYLNTGNTMMLSEDTIDDNNVATYAKGLAGAPIPIATMGTPVTGTNDKGEPMSTSQAAKATPGEPFKNEDGSKVSYYQVAGTNKEGEKVKGLFPNGNMHMTTDEAGLAKVADYYNKQSDIINDETDEKRENDTTDTVVAGMDPNGPPEENEKLLRLASDKLCDDYAKACKDIMDDIDAKLNQDRKSVV